MRGVVRPDAIVVCLSRCTSVPRMGGAVVQSAGEAGTRWAAAGRRQGRDIWVGGDR